MSTTLGQSSTGEREQKGMSVRGIVVQPGELADTLERHGWQLLGPSPLRLLNQGIAPARKPLCATERTNEYAHSTRLKFRHSSHTVVSNARTAGRRMRPMQNKSSPQARMALALRPCTENMAPSTEDRPLNV